LTSSAHATSVNRRQRMFDVVLTVSQSILIVMLMLGTVGVMWWVWLEIRGIMDDVKRSKGP